MIAKVQGVKTEVSQEAPARSLPSCTREAEHLDIILACDGAANVGQIGHEVAVELTNSIEEARMCCITAVAAESKAHVDIARRARKLIVINGCANHCASKVLERLDIPYAYEVTVTKEGVEKAPTLGLNADDVRRIKEKITEEALGHHRPDAAVPGGAVS